MNVNVILLAFNIGEVLTTSAVYTTAGFGHDGLKNINYLLCLEMIHTI